MLSPFLDLQLRKGVFKEENASFLGKFLFNKTNKQKQKTKPKQKNPQENSSTQQIRN